MAAPGSQYSSSHTSQQSVLGGSCAIVESVLEEGKRRTSILEVSPSSPIVPQLTKLSELGTSTFLRSPGSQLPGPDLSLAQVPATCLSANRGRTPPPSVQPSTRPQAAMSSHPPHATLSASSFLHLAPPSSKELTPDEIRALVLEYLVSSCFADSAQAFAREVEENRLESAGAVEAGLKGTGGRGRKASVGSVMSGVEGTAMGKEEVFVDALFDPDGDEVMRDEGEEETDELEDEREVESTLRTNGVGGKTVAFEEEEDGRGWPLLSREELRELKLRRGMWCFRMDERRGSR